MTEDFIFGTTKFSEEVVRRKQEQLRTVWHAHRILPHDPLPGQSVEILVDVGLEHRTDGVYCYWTTGDEQPLGKAGKATCGQVLALDQIGPIWKELIWGYVQRWRGVLPPQKKDTHIRYRIEAWDALRQKSVFADTATEDPLSDPPFSFHVDHWSAPDWIRDAVIYNILVDRFYPGDGHDWLDASIARGVLGGTIKGIIDKLPYIAELGADVLWISPITESPSWHGYNTSDHRTVAARLGTNDDFHQLVQTAHQMGIRILLDFVVHATSDDHPFLKAALADRTSPYYHWYTFTDWPDEYDCFWGVKVMPHFNLEYPDTRKYILDTARMWALEYGVDGFRLDYAIKPSFDFWVDLQKSLKEAKEDCVTLGEAVASPEALLAYEGKLDGCLDFLLAEQIRSTFAYTNMDLVAFDRNLHMHEAYFGEAFVRPSFIDNHDMNRFIFIVNGDLRRLKLAAICQFTLSQPPILLYGTEIGLSQQAHSVVDLDYVREPMHWQETADNELLEFYRHLIKIRKSHAALSKGSRQTLYADADTLIYAKSHVQETCLVALNRSDRKKKVTLKMSGYSRRYRDAFSNTIYDVKDGELKLSLSPWQGCILVPVS